MIKVNLLIGCGSGNKVCQQSERKCQRSMSTKMSTKIRGSVNKVEGMSTKIESVDKFVDRGKAFKIEG